jgi:hypothetical protein
MRGSGLATIMTAAGAALLGAVPAAASGWTVVPAPPPDGGFFNAVSARTDSGAWAVADLSAGRSTNSHGAVSNLTLRNG